jgi:hypothetical protein
MESILIDSSRDQRKTLPRGRGYIEFLLPLELLRGAETADVFGYLRRVGIELLAGVDQLG